MDGEDQKAVMTSPLLNRNTSYDYPEIVTELKKQMKLAGPLIVVIFLQFSLLMISVMFVGHLGELSLSGASMGVAFANVTDFSVIMGMGSALETFCGQAYGAKQEHMLGIHAQRAMLVLTFLTIPIASLWTITDKIFVCFGQDPSISEQAGIYARWMIPGILPFGLLQCQIRFLQAQSNVLPLIMSSGMTTLVHVVVCWTLVSKLGFQGAALSSAVSYWTNVLILAVYIRFSASCRGSWVGFSKEGFKNVSGFLKLGVPSALMVCLEYWAFEFLLFMSGLLPNPKLQTSVMSISFNTCSLAYRIPYGLSNAVSTRIANELGAGRPRNASLAMYLVIGVAIVQGILLSTTVFLLRNEWGYLYTKELEVVRYLGSVMPVIACATFMDGIQGVLQGVIRGCGMQKMGAIVNLGAYYLVGIPCAMAFAFPLHYEGKGLWLGVACASTSHACLLITILFCTKWNNEVNKVKERLSCDDPN